VGGNTLAWLARTMQQDGAIASYGNAGGAELHTSVFPFILRGVKLLGVDSAATLMPLRKQVWQRLAGDPSTGLRTGLRPRNFEQIAHTVPFAELSGIFPKMIAGETRGRIVVKISGE
jgi:NADPH2:quinone reductase